MAGDFYSTTAARRSLIHFAFGKVGAAVSGLAFLLATLRLVPVEVFGAYVALMALTEIFYTASSLGLSYFAQRYVPELRIRASGAQFNKQLRSLLAARAALAAVFILPVWLTKDQWSGSLGLELSTAIATGLALNLFFGSVMRYIDELLQTLLLQGWVQIQSVTRNLTRIAGLGVGVLLAGGISLQLLLVMQAAVSALAVGAGLWMFRIYMKRTEFNLSQNPAPHDIPDAWTQCLRFYIAQLLAQAYSGNAIKLVVTAVIGVHGTAVLGFATSISDLLKNYSPAFLLGSWVRPIMVSRFVRDPTVASLAPLTRLVVNLSIVGLLPFAVVFAIFGQEVGALLAGGKYPEAAPLLAPLVGMVCLTALHAALAMVCATVERTAFVLRATAFCTCTLPLAYLLTLYFGLAGTVLSLCLGELLWIASVMTQLAAHFGRTDFSDARGIARGILLAVALGIPLALFDDFWPLASTAAWLTASVTVAILYWILAWYWGVIALEQRELIARFLRYRSARDAT